VDTLNRMQGWVYARGFDPHSRKHNTLGTNSVSGVPRFMVAHLDPRERATDGSRHPVGHVDQIQGVVKAEGTAPGFLLGPGEGSKGSRK